MFLTGVLCTICGANVCFISLYLFFYFSQFEVKQSTNIIIL